MTYYNSLNTLYTLCTGTTIIVYIIIILGSTSYSPTKKNFKYRSVALVVIFVQHECVLI